MRQLSPRRGGFAVLASPPFIAALLALLANDFWLKPLLHDGFTGKLSDFTGLFVFASLCLMLVPNLPRLVLLGVACFFAWWKSPLSQPAIEFCNAHLYLALHRVVDYSDLTAIAVLPLAWKNFRYWRVRGASRFVVYPIGVAALFAMTATSQIAVVEGGALRPQDTQAAFPTAAQLNGVMDTFAGSHGLGLVPGRSDDVHRDYEGGRYALEANYDAATGTLYYGFGPVIADGWPLNPFAKRRASGAVVRMEQEFVAALAAQFPALKPETGRQFERYGDRHHYAGFDVTFPRVANVCDSDDRDLRIALEAVDQFAAEHHMRPGLRYAFYQDCTAEAGHAYVLGAPEGPYMQSFPIVFGAGEAYDRARLHVSLGWSDTEPEASGWMNQLHDRLAALDWQDPDVQVSEVFPPPGK